MEKNKFKKRANQKTNCHQAKQIYHCFIDGCLISLFVLNLKQL